MRRRVVALGVVAIAVLSLGGCGGPITPDELARSVETLESTAAEGALLAGDVAEDRTKATFVRVHSRDLGDIADHEAEKLQDAEADDASVAAAKTRAVDLADRIAGTLGMLQTAPGSETEGRTAADALEHLSEDAGRLADRL